MAFSVMEIAGIALISVATIMQISAVGTLKWRTFELKPLSAMTASYDYGLFRACGTIKTAGSERELCTSLPDTDENKGAYGAVKATSIITILSLFTMIGVILSFKIFLKKSTFLPSIIIGSVAVIFGAITVIVYASAVKMPSPESALDASFYVAIVAIILNLVGVIVHGAGAKSSE